MVSQGGRRVITGDSSRRPPLLRQAREAPGNELPQTSDCNVCHQDHGAVDTTFVQFYPTLMPIAKAKGTLSDKYVAEEKAAVK